MGIARSTYYSEATSLVYGANTANRPSMSIYIRLCPGTIPT